MIDYSKIIIKPVNVYYLRMEHPLDKNVIEIDQSITFTALNKPITSELYLKYYEAVGFKYHWLDRLVMPKEELTTKINAPNVHMYTMQVDENDAGFIEFVQENEYVELLYFGLLPGFIGKGLGRYFLNWCIEKAWSYNPKWIQLNTCELDHPQALPNYRKLGFKDYMTALEDRRVLID